MCSLPAIKSSYIYWLKMWNSLNYNIRNVDTLSKFKSELKKIDETENHSVPKHFFQVIFIGFVCVLYQLSSRYIYWLCMCALPAIKSSYIYWLCMCSLPAIKSSYIYWLCMCSANKYNDLIAGKEHIQSQ
jgi:hypothetical protein